MGAKFDVNDVVKLKDGRKVYVTEILDFSFKGIHKYKNKVHFPISFFDKVIVKDKKCVKKDTKSYTNINTKDSNKNIDYELIYDNYIENDSSLEDEEIIKIYDYEIRCYKLDDYYCADIYYANSLNFCLLEHQNKIKGQALRFALNFIKIQYDKK